MNTLLKRIISTKASIAVTPLLFAAYPVLALAAHNRDKLHFSATFRPLILLELACLLIYTCAAFFFRNSYKAAISTSVIFVITFSFGHVITLLEQATSKPVSGSANFYSVAVLFSLYIFLNIILAHAHRIHRTWFYIFTVVGITINIVPIVSLGVKQIHNQKLNQLSQNYSESSKINLPYLPDIYYIILDGHARTDVLKQLYKYDNSEFISELQRMNFYVASKSNTNYPQTYLSLASSLNTNYLDKLTPLTSTDSTDRQALADLINNSQVFNFFADQQYSLLSIATGWSGTEHLIGMDTIYRAPETLTEFEILLIQTTPAAFFRSDRFLYAAHRRAILYAFEKLSEIANRPESTFTYAHIIAPHPPFVFNAQGQAIEPSYKFSLVDLPSYQGGSSEKYKKQYAQQIEHIDSQILQTVKKIIANSTHPPIIILQSDHGPASEFIWESNEPTIIKERTSILNAYYFPEKKIQYLYESITPVNTFRVIYKTFWDLDYPLLEDKIIMASWAKPYQFRDITHLLK